MIKDELDTLFLTFNIFFEARDQSEIGKIAAAYTVINRMNDGKNRWPKTIYGVLDQNKQFSWHNNMTINFVLDALYGEPVAYLECQIIAKKVLNGIVDDPTLSIGGANHYHATWLTKQPKHYVDAEKIDGFQEMVLDEHVFYRL